MHPSLRPLLAVLSAVVAAHAGTGNVDVVPPPIGDASTVPLDGTWRFRYHAGADAGVDEKFWQPNFDVSAWGQIKVPGHWELQGWAEPHYADDLQEGLGLYRRSFSVPADWRKEGRRTFLRFEGVLFGYTVWVNGQPVGEWNSGFNPATFDVTDALKPDGGQNEVAVRVTTHGRGWDFDTMDCWSISGIYREARLFSLPATHLKEWAARTTLAPDGTAHVSVDLAASGTATVSAKLLGPDGSAAGAFTATLGSEGRGQAEIVVAKPALWTAETPHLYTLQLDLGGQQVSTRIGLREVTTTGGVLRLNGQAIKLRGVDHHEIWPETGRTATEANLRRDLQVMRAANVNFIRTSHYPPHPRLLELCDELGFYVDDEVPYIHGRRNLKDKAYLPDLLARARATVLRDRNHPCVLFWTTGNENPVTTNGARVGETVRALDPSRTFAFPTIGSAFDEYLDHFPSDMGIYAPHYPSVKKAPALAKVLTRPIVFTEYAHQRGVARGGNGIQDLWETFRREERIAGGAIWHFQDQGLLRVATDPGTVTDGDQMVWLDAHRYYDTHGFSAVDGIVYSDRTPQLDYWQVRKVYSPIQVEERRLPAEPRARTLSVHLENRYDFRTLEGVKLRWEVVRNGTAVSSGERALATPPHGQETLSFPVELAGWPATDVLSLRLTFTDRDGAQPYERSLPIDVGTPAGARLAKLLAGATAKTPQVAATDAMVTVTSRGHTFTFDRATGQTTLRRADGTLLADGFGPNAGHAPTINDQAKGRERLPQIWGYGLLREAKDVHVVATTAVDGSPIVEVQATYPRPGKPEQALKGSYTLKFARDGSVRVSYDYTPIAAEGEASQVGFSVSVPATLDQFRWLGQGPYAGYAGKDRQNEYGAFHLGRGDLYFPGNRRGVEFAALGTSAGTGLLLAGTDLTIDLEETPTGTLLSPLAPPQSERATTESKGDGTNTSSRVKLSSQKHIRGEFTLLPLDPTWPAELMDWLGRPGQPAKVFSPFLRSYDR